MSRKEQKELLKLLGLKLPNDVFYSIEITGKKHHKLILEQNGKRYMVPIPNSTSDHRSKFNIVKHARHTLQGIA